MADAPRPQEPAAVPPTGRRPWSPPRLLEYGHIGKLTQGSSGTMSDSGTKRKTCL